MHLQLDKNSNPGDLYHFDPVAAEHPIKFCHQYCCNYIDRWAGQPFQLLDFQQQWMRDIYGWKRADDKRRFREVFLECPKGNGKSPWLTICGLYELLASGEEGALVISAATDFQQANITFDFAKKIILNSPRLRTMADDGRILVKQYSIEYPATNSVWRVMSGNFEGKAGFMPTCILLDEAWEWPNRKMYASLTRNAKKRSQPLVYVATNSGNRKDTIAWELHERAQNVLKGKSKDDTLYPIVYCADEKEDPGSEELWQRVNPALDQIITTETLREEWVKAKENPADEAEFRRLHAGQWVLGGAQKYFNMAAWADCTEAFDAEAVKHLPCVLGLDMSLNDDLTALVAVWWDSDRWYVKPYFWLPRQTAWKYQDKAGINYGAWEALGHINLIDADTIDPQTQRDIADFIAEFKQTNKLKYVCYDPAKATNIIALLEEAGTTCVTIQQGFWLSPELEELSRRLKDRSVTFDPNGVMEFCAGNAEVKPNDKGFIRLVKESAEGNYKGNRNYKIDGIQALLTALAQVRKEQMTPAAKPSVYESRGVLVI